MEHCSVLAAARDESMVGTAFTERGLLLVEQPGAWGRQGLADSDLDHAVAVELQRRADAADLRLLAVRRPDGANREAIAGGRSWAVRPAGSTLLSWGRFGAEADLLDVPLDGSAGAPAEEPTYLVCTHAKRDVCCALFARPVAAALAALRPVHVWGCSHTGGSRFAPVVVAVPARGETVVYGRVGTDAVADLVAATEAGRVLPDLLRGVAGHPAYVQAALAHALGDHPVPAAWTVDGVEPVAAGEWRVTLAGPSPVTLEVRAHTGLEPMVSCGKPEPSEQTHYAVSTASR
ncbi:MAG TPA: sucrase ferredoxin [Nocardioides sp.]|nr:sucrase ferredoxin [Nocardioides sp.]